MPVSTISQKKFEFPGVQVSTAIFVVPPLAHLLDISGPAHIFYEATDYGAPLKLKFVSITSDQKEQETSSGITFSKLEDFSKINLKKGDLVFIPGLERELLFDNKFQRNILPFTKWLNIQHANGAAICSVCTGAFVLAQAGLLNGRKCTTHWKYHELFRKTYPKAELQNNRLFVADEEVYSSAGVSSGIDLGLYLLERKFGTRFASAIAREVVVYLRRGEEDPQLSVFMQYRNHIDDRIHLVQEWLAKNIDKKHTVDDLADLAATSSRHLTRQFKDTTGITIGQYVDKLRVEQAVNLLRDHAKIDAVAKACGLKSTNQLRTLLRKFQVESPNPDAPDSKETRI
jgi:transcriptional regulator GlxA family with amidase domain